MNKFTNRMYHLISFFITGSILLAACSLPSFQTATPTVDAGAIATSVFFTAVARITEEAAKVTPTLTDTPTSTLTFTPTATEVIVLKPMDARCTANVQVRSRPSSGGDNLGGIIFGRTVQVLARNQNGVWLLIAFIDAPSGQAWVRASAFELSGDIGILPVAYLDADNQLYFRAPVTWVVEGTPLPLPTLSAADQARKAAVIGPGMVRVCPSMGCSKIGMLSTGQEIIITGRTEGNAWAQFNFPSGKNGTGWVIKDAIQQVEGAFSGLPFYDSLGDLVTPEPPTATPDPNLSPTPTRTATPTPAGPLAQITDTTTVYSKQSSLSDVIGTLNRLDKIHIVSQSFNHLWFEIQYPDYTESRGYISTKNVKLLGDFRYLPYTDANGTPFPTAAPAKKP